MNKAFDDGMRYGVVYRMWVGETVYPVSCGVFFLAVFFPDIIAQVAHIYIWACFGGRQLASAPVSIWGFGRDLQIA